MNIRHPLLILLWKEFALDIRNKYGFWSLILYTIGSIYVVYVAFQVKSVRISPPTWNTLFWILVVYNAFQSVSKSFFYESESRNLYYYFNTSPEWVILAKIVYNSILIIVLACIAWLFYTIILGDPMQNKLGFLTVICIGAVGIASILSLICGMAAKAGRSHILMTVLGFPVLIPVLLYLIQISSFCIDGFSMIDISEKWIVLCCIDGVVIALAWVLFPFIWKN